jgi:hypothetical protein
LQLTIHGTWLEPIVADFEEELQRAGVRRLRPRFYLTTEWGVPFDTVAIGIPFYLARPDLTALHAERIGHIEGVSRDDILQYLRHEMGHVVNYAYRLYDNPEWIRHFGSITRPYEEEYSKEPFSRRFVLHLPGWYAQKHPDEDWAETFAVWMTPGRNWREEYADWPIALAKLNYCDRTMKTLAERDPLISAIDLDEDVGDLNYSIEHYYHQFAPPLVEELPRLDGAILTVFAGLDRPSGPGPGAARRSAGALIRRLERELMANIYRWTGHFPERTRSLLRHLAERADQLHLVYLEDREDLAIVALTTLVTALAMNHVRYGTYIPASDTAKTLSPLASEEKETAGP